MALAFSVLGGTAAFAAEESGQKMEETAVMEAPEEMMEQAAEEQLDPEALAKEYIPVLMYHHFKDDNTIPDGDGIVTADDVAAIESEVLNADFMPAEEYYNRPQAIGGVQVAKKPPLSVQAQVAASKIPFTKGGAP